MADEGMSGAMERLGSVDRSPGIVRNPGRNYVLSSPEYTGLLPTESVLRLLHDS